MIFVQEQPRVAGERQALHPGQFRNLNLIQDGGSPPILYNRNALRGKAHALRALRKIKRVKTFFTLMAGSISKFIFWAATL